MKTRHNKKRNTAVLYEVLVRELTKCVVEEDKKGKKNALSLLKEFFKKGKPLAVELELYKTLLETQGLDDETAKRLLDRVLQTHGALDKDRIFIEQSSLLKKMNKSCPKAIFSNFVPDYKNLASISQMFSSSVSVKDKVLLEQKVLGILKSKEEEKSEQKMEVLDTLTYKTFVNKFNSVYGEALLPEQKELVTRFVMSFADNGVELKTYLNEEVSRLKGIIESSCEDEEIKSDETMLENTRRVLGRLNEYNTMPVDNKLVEEVLKIQNLVKEIEG